MTELKDKIKQSTGILAEFDTLFLVIDMTSRQKSKKGIEQYQFAPFDIHGVLKPTATKYSQR